MDLQFQEIQARHIVSIHKHVDGPWFWDKYSARPYTGCRSGCAFCYMRGGQSLGQRDPETFDTLIQVKVNAVELLQRELVQLKPDVISLGDWQQPAEDRYQISRAMLEVLSEFDFPLLVIERSPLVMRDIDLLTAINQKSSATVVFSISSLDPEIKHAFEPRSPGIHLRLQAMARLASAGIRVGTALMPVLPFLGDDEDSLEQVIRATREHGGEFVLAAGLSMAGAQAHYTLEAARQLNPEVGVRIKELYRWQEGGTLTYSPPQSYTIRLGRTVRRLCAKHGIADRIPRYIPDNDLAVNRWVAEKLFNKTYDLEMEGANAFRIWAYRKAAWLVDEMEQNLASLYYAGGEKRIQDLPGIGAGLASEIAGWIRIYERQPRSNRGVH